MATRQETQSKRRAMREGIAEACRSGRVGEGELLPTVRELARQYGLSIALASEVVQSLEAEGVLYARPGVGIIAGNPRPLSPGTYLYLLPAGVSPEYAAGGHIGAAQRGFEVAIAQLGGACLTLEAALAVRYAAAGQLPPIAGVFSIEPDDASEFLRGTGLGRVSFDVPLNYGERHEGQSPASVLDSVSFDNLGGGQQATRHLLAAGYGSIAFLALHAPEEPGEFGWSAAREAGWREAMEEAGKSSRDMAFHPQHTPLLHTPRKGPYRHGGEQEEAAREAVAPLVEMVIKGRVTAVVAVNYLAARTFFGVLQDNRVAREIWPAAVCFDSYDGLDNLVVSALNLPWDEVGKAAARLLWERNVGRLRGPQTVRQVPMQLIPRLTSRRDWTAASDLLVRSGQIGNPTVPF